jgi:hypothetical protein
MVPEVGYRDEAMQQRPRNYAEVADTHALTRQGQVNHPIHPIQDSERVSFGSASPLRKYDAIGPLLFQRANKSGNILRPVLAVSIHDDDCVPLPMCLQVCEPDGDGTLMTDVSPKTQYLDGRDPFCANVVER